MLILKNYTISNNKEKIISPTIDEGDDIAVITFFATKPQKKGGGRHFLAAKPSKKVAANVVLFFNINLLPSPSTLQPFYATMHKK
jgi:hypothetical protein